jgi:hypothetical protein
MLSRLEEVKLQAKELKLRLKESGIPAKQCAIYELLAKNAGYANWNMYCGFLKQAGKINDND